MVVFRLRSSSSSNSNSSNNNNNKDNQWVASGKAYATQRRGSRVVSAYGWGSRIKNKAQMGHRRNPQQEVEKDHNSERTDQRFGTSSAMPLFARSHLRRHRTSSAPATRGRCADSGLPRQVWV